MTSEGLGEMFEGEFADGKIFALVDGGTSNTVQRAQTGSED